MRQSYEPKKRSINKLKQFLERIESIELEIENSSEPQEQEDDFFLNVVDSSGIDLDDQEKIYDYLIGIDFICTNCLNTDKIYKSATFRTLKFDDGFVEFRAVCRKCRAKAVSKSIKKREDADEDFKFLNRFRISQASRLRMIIKGGYKRDSFYKVIGCTKDEFLSHITAQMQDGMTMENYGRGGWSIDHLIPISWARDKDEIAKLSLYTNLAPRWETDNSSKGNKWGELLIDGKLVKVSKEEYYGLMITSPCPTKEPMP